MQTEQKYDDLRINGSMVVTGGTFNTVAVNGSATLNGDIHCKEFKINGTCEVKRSLKTEKGTVRGNAEIKEDLYVGDFNIYGNASMKGNMFASIINVKGACDVGESLSAEHIQTYGRLRVGENCQAEDFYSEGYFEIGDTLKANSVELIMRNHSKSSVEKIFAEKVHVKMQEDNTLVKVLKSIFSSSTSRGRLKIEEIHGETITLENTKAELVKGNNVTLGKNCIVELVEYSDTLNIVANAIVKESRKIEK
ncbi:polymer-forming cytoskeletal protein [Bacillus alkalisoli]|uniref:polymer-forming cytoskeletal protein n=1 Tax=Bacillus alkalisoli TaxID=2011008 RepID=UPI0012FEA659|nr:polymer-forming cytoskeletal protein [Bacillus alkalisoli]